MNDIDLWNDAEEAERRGESERASSLYAIYNILFNEYDKDKANLLIEKHYIKFKEKVNV